MKLNLLLNLTCYARRLRQNLRRTIHSLSLLAGAGIAGISFHAEAGTIYGLTDDRQVNGNGTLDDVSLMYAGKIAGTYNSDAVFAFPLPTLPVGQRFDTASFTAYLSSKWGTPTFNLDLYGLGPKDSPVVGTDTFYAGALDSTQDLIQDNFLTPSSPNVSFPSTSNSMLADCLNSYYGYGANAGKYVQFRLSPDSTSGYSTLAYLIASAENGAPSTYYKPKLTYTTVPIGPSGWAQVPLGGGGYVTGFATDASGADVYCRTDVGGVFRWDNTAEKWDSISDKIVVDTEFASTLMSVSSFAVDPSNANLVYMAVGSPTANSYGTFGPNALPETPYKGLYASTNKGSTWTPINTSISILGSDGARGGYGERLAVDPNNSNVLWFGTRTEGLKKLTKVSGVWGVTQIASSLVPYGGANGTTSFGVIFTACDKNAGSTIVYAGVYDVTGTTGGVYKSTDSGTTWTKVTGATITAPHQARVDSNGTLYVTAGAEGVFKMPRGGTLSAITPVTGVGYHGLSVGVADNTLFVAEAAQGYYNRIWRSTNEGSTWTVQGTNIASTARTEPDGTPCVTSSWFSNVAAIQANPTNSNELWAGDFFGVDRTQDAQNLGVGTGSFWYGLSRGQEETVVLAVKNSPTGARLFTGTADVGGYLYYDTYTPPVQIGDYPAGKRLPSPGGGNTNSLDFCESNDAVWARTWTKFNDPTSVGTGASSVDGGETWLPFGGITQKTVSNNATAGPETFDVSAFIANQKALNHNLVTLVFYTTSGSSVNVLPFDSNNSTTDPALKPKLIIDGSTEVPIVADSYVWAQNPTTNYGTATINLSGGNDTFRRWFYLKIDLTAVSSVSTATIQLNRRSVATNTAAFPVQVFACNNTTWSESTITWSNRPATVASPTDPMKDPDMGSLKGGRIAVSATDPNNMVWLPMGNGATARYSKDRGATWLNSTGGPGSQTDTPLQPALQQLTADRVDGSFYLARFGTGTGNSSAYIYKSTNGGANWTQVGTISSFYDGIRGGMFAAPGVAGDLWAKDEGKGVWHSTDGGQNWAKVKSSNILACRSMSFGMPLAGSGQSYSVYINAVYTNGTTTAQRIYRSDDGGTTWSPLGTSLPTIQNADIMSGDRQVYGRVFIGTSGRGIFQYQP